MNDNLCLLLFIGTMIERRTKVVEEYGKSTVNSNLGEKQDNLSKFDYLGNINDITGNIVCWVNSSNASGTMPCEGYFQLQQSCDGYNSIQHAFVYIDNNQPPYVYIRMHVNGGWTNWGKLIY